MLPKNVAVSSIDSITSSIKYDFQVYRWFTLLITHPSVKRQFINDTHAQNIYNELQKLSRLQGIIVLILISLIISYLISQQIIFLGPIFLLIYFVYRVGKRSRDLVSRRSETILKQDFEESKLRQNTLYQIAEFYSSQYNIPSLVDTIYLTDNILRKIFMLIVIFDISIYVFVYQFNIINNLLLVFTIYYSCYFLIHSSANYYRLR